MLLKHFYDDKLAQASYLIGCAATGEALVVDASRDVEQYITAAEAEGLRITHVTETHIHADFVSGSRELAQRTNSRLFLSAEGGPEWRYAFASQAGATLLRDGDSFMVGNVRIDVLHTPGHTPEHLTFLVTDTPATDRPMGALTGDFLFVGDVGRPDLLERAAGYEGTMEAGARTLFHSLRKLDQLPDYLQIWPGHGAGSACGKSLGAVPQSTLGYERIANWGLQVHDEDEFARLVLAGQPEPPKYFAEMKRINRDGPRILGHFERPPRMPATALAGILEKGALVVDTRHAADFASAHVPGTINIPLNRSFNTWAGWLVPYDRDFYLVVDDQCTNCIDDAVRDLAMIGLDRVSGYFGADVVQRWAADGHYLGSIRQIDARQLATDMAAGDVAVLDVRGHTEWEGGHIPGVPNIPLGYLTDHLAELERSKPLVVHCQSGTRSAIAASVLQANGFANVLSLTGGIAAWRGSGHRTEQETPAEQVTKTG
jgi:hydroxyacylglutathione hydrolase